MTLRGVVKNWVMHFRTASASGFESHTDLNPLDSLNGHNRLSEFSVEFAIPLRMGP